MLSTRSERKKCSCHFASAQFYREHKCGLICQFANAFRRLSVSRVFFSRFCLLSTGFEIAANLFEFMWGMYITSKYVYSLQHLISHCQCHSNLWFCCTFFFVLCLLAQFFPHFFLFISHFSCKTSCHIWILIYLCWLFFVRNGWGCSRSVCVYVVMCPAFDGITHIVAISC